MFPAAQAVPKLRAQYEKLYRDRKVTTSGRAILASRVGAHADLDFSRDLSDSARAVVFQLAEAGEVGGTVQAVIPHRDAFLLAATSGSLWSLHGDPTTGVLRNVSRDVGIVGENAWCKAGDAVYFLSSRGLYVVGADGSGLKALSEDVVPEELVGLTGSGPSLTYQDASKSVYCHLPGQPVSWLYDAARGALWPFSEDEPASHVLLGPFPMGPPNDFGLFQSLHGILAAGSAGAVWHIVTGETAEEAGVRGKAAITASLAGGDYSQYVSDSGTWAAGRSLASRPRVRAAWAVIWLSCDGAWAYESVIAEVVPAGRIRL